MVKKRNTKSKQMILAILEQSKIAMSQDDILRDLDEKVDRVTVYRTLLAYEQEGLIHRIVDDAGKWYYAVCDSCNEEHHHDEHVHFKCNECGHIECLDAVVKQPVLPDGYQVKNVSSLVFGYCKLCTHHED